MNAPIEVTKTEQSERRLGPLPTIVNPSPSDLASDEILMPEEAL
jgi:hypothetical protein